MADSVVNSVSNSVGSGTVKKVNLNLVKIFQTKPVSRFKRISLDGNLHFPCFVSAYYVIDIMVAIGWRQIN